MAYCTTNDCLARISEQELIRLFADKASPGAAEPAAVDNDLFDPAADAAAETIDGYLRRHYALPLAPVPTAIVRVAVILTLYDGYQRRRAVTQMIQDEYDRTISWLRDVGAGKADLGLVPPPTETSSRGIEYTTAKRVMTRENLMGL